MASKVKGKKAKAASKASRASSRGTAKGGAPASSGAPSQQGLQRRRTPEEAQHSETILDDRSRRDIAGVIFAVLAVIALLLAILPADALISGLASSCVHRLFGIGCYILPLLFLGISAAFFLKLEGRRKPARLAIGLGMMFIAMLAVFALFAPIANLGQDNPDLLFSNSVLEGYGGYIGSAVAWAGLVLFGRMITAVILAGIVVIGCVIVGFSMSSAIERLRSSAGRIGSQASLRHRNPSSASNGFARVRQQPAQNVYDDDVMAFLEAESALDGFDPNNTIALDARGKAPVETGLPIIDAGYNAPMMDFDARNECRSVASQHFGEVRSTRLDISDIDEGGSLTRKLSPAASQDARSSLELSAFSGGLVPIVHEGTFSRGLSEPCADALDPLDGFEDDAAGIDGGSDDVHIEWGDMSDDALDLEQPFADDLEGLSQTASGDVAQGKGIAREGSSASMRAGSSNPRKAVRSASDASRNDGEELADECTAPYSSGEPCFRLPPMSLLNRPGRKGRTSRSGLEATAKALQKVLSDFRIDARVVEWIAGPTVTLFEVDLPAGVRVSRIISLSNDIALALASPGVRIFAPVPGTNYVGIEVPNSKRETVFLSEVLDDAPDGPLQIAIGKDVEGNSIVSDLAKMPHLLIGGTTGSGKSVSINGMIMSILMRATPDEVRFIMIDPKRVEFTPYNGIPHLYVPVVTEPVEAANALAWAVAEMERRLKIFSKPDVAVRNITQYNAKVAQLALAASDDSDVACDDAGQPQQDEESLEHMPYIVIIIDELADLMMNIGKEVEISISRLAQLARAAGIHLIVATQRPSTNVVTGLIKANITNRIAFNVASSIDSRVILDSAGAESLIGLGDLLLSKPELARPQRIQGCFVTEDEISKVVDFAKSQGDPEYHGEILSTNVITLGSSSPNGGDASGPRDPYIWEAADIVVSSGMGSTSNLQRRLKVGYARAGRIMDQLEEIGVVGPANGSKPREVLLDEMELETVKAFEMSD